MSGEEAEEVSAREKQEVAGLLGNRVGGTWLVIQEGQLAKDVPRAKGMELEESAIGGADSDRNLTSSDEVEVRPRIAFPKDDSALRVPPPSKTRRQFVDLGARQLGEEPDTN